MSTSSSANGCVGADALERRAGVVAEVAAGAAVERDASSSRERRASARVGGSPPRGARATRAEHVAAGVERRARRGGQRVGVLGGQQLARAAAAGSGAHDARRCRVDERQLEPLGRLTLVPAPSGSPRSNAPSVKRTPLVRPRRCSSARRPSGGGGGARRPRTDGRARRRRRRRGRRAARWRARRASAMSISASRAAGGIVTRGGRAWRRSAVGAQASASEAAVAPGWRAGPGARRGARTRVDARGRRGARGDCGLRRRAARRRRRRGPAAAGRLRAGDQRGAQLARGRARPLADELRRLDGGARGRDRRAARDAPALPGIAVSAAPGAARSGLSARPRPGRGWRTATARSPWPTPRPRAGGGPARRRRRRRSRRAPRRARRAAAAPVTPSTGAADAARGDRRERPVARLGEQHGARRPPRPRRRRAPPGSSPARTTASRPRRLRGPSLQQLRGVGRPRRGPAVSSGLGRREAGEHGGAARSRRRPRGRCGRRARARRARRRRARRARGRASRPCRSAGRGALAAGRGDDERPEPRRARDGRASGASAKPA